MNRWHNQVSIKVHEPSLTEMKPVTCNKEVQTAIDDKLDFAVANNESLETDDENDINVFFPDPAEFLPQSPDFSFPPLPPTPPEMDETETITSSTILKTAIEVLPEKIEENKREKEKREAKLRMEEKAKLEKLEVKKDKLDKRATDKKEKPSILVDKRNKHANIEKKRHKKENFNHLKVPQVQLQVSSEREIVDSIVVIKNKAEKKEEKLNRKSKRKKERKEHGVDHQHILDCNDCQEERVRKRREREMIRSDDIGLLPILDII